MTRTIHKYLIKENGAFPNSPLQVIYYKNILNIPALFPATAVKKLFRENGWSNNWREGIQTQDHYHSNTHEAIAVIKGQTTLLLGGKGGKKLQVEKGDVVIIPAGVAHKNLGKEKDAICVGGYPEGKEFDMNYGEEGERPAADKNIKKVPVPLRDPVFGDKKGIVTIWQ